MNQVVIIPDVSLRLDHAVDKEQRTELQVIDVQTGSSQHYSYKVTTKEKVQRCLQSYLFLRESFIGQISLLWDVELIVGLKLVSKPAYIPQGVQDIEPSRLIFLIHLISHLFPMIAHIILLCVIV